MKNLQILVIVGILFFSMGCAAKRAVETYNHEPADLYDVDNSIKVSKDFDTSWNDSVKSLTSTFYTINNIEKESRIINVSFRSNNVNKYIDCGISTIEILYKGKTTNFWYLTAGDAIYESLWTTDRNYSIWSEVNQESIISGTANIYFNPISNEKTEIRVNINYRLQTTLKGKDFSHRESGEYLFETSSNNTFETELTTTSPSYYGKNKQIICRSKQVLEESLLEILK
jgi:hypothetical protein